jgi:guanylate kinase
MENDLFHRPSYPLLIVLSGTTGAGKDSVIRRMQERRIPFEFVVTATSRPPRPAEIDGKDYLFLSEADFQEMIRKDELLEHAIVYSQHKGIPKSHVRAALATGKDVVLRVDIQGAATIRKKYPQAVTIFLLASSEEELERRLSARNTETPEQIAIRLRTAREELNRIPEFDYAVINVDGLLDQTVDTIQAILRAEHTRAIPRRIIL